MSLDSFNTLSEKPFNPTFDPEAYRQHLVEVKKLGKKGYKSLNRIKGQLTQIESYYRIRIENNSDDRSKSSI
jgi:hypothetical protein